MRKGLIAVVIVVLSTSTTTALANPDNVEPSNTGDGATVEVDTQTTAPGSEGDGAPAAGGEGGNANVTCEYYAVSDGNEAEPGEPSTFKDGARVFISCTDQTTGYIVYAQEVIWSTAVPAPTIPPQVLAERARAKLTLPLPDPRTWPDVDQVQTVGVSTWLHVTNFTADQKSASAGPVTATVYAEPTAVDWTMGDGGSTRCTTSGAVWDGTNTDSPDCGHLFINRSSTQPDGKFHGTVSITWRLRWDSNTGQSGDLGDVTRTSDVAWTVRELQAVIG